MSIKDEHGVEIPRELVDEVRTWREQRYPNLNDSDALTLLECEFGLPEDVLWKIIAS